jgi:hypothetical protein
MHRLWKFLARAIAPHLDREASAYSAADIEAFCAAWNRFSR